MQKRRGGMRLHAWGLAAILPVAAFAAMIWQRRWTSDDGFINIRIVTNLLAGHGPVFNAGERVEAYTSTLWLGIIAFLGRLGVEPATGAMWAALLLSVLGVVFAQLGAITLSGGEGDEKVGGSILQRMALKRMLPLGVVAYVALPVAWDFGTSGLDTGLSIAWLGLSFFLIARWVERVSEKERGLPYVTAMVIGLGPLVRPDLALFSFGFLVPLLWATYSGRVFRPWGALKLAAAMGALPVGYQIFRMGYFAAIVPNTAIAKSAFGSNWSQGWSYFENFYVPYALAIPALFFFLFLLNVVAESVANRDFLKIAAYVTPVACALLHGVYVVKVGGDFMHGRMLLPTLFSMLLPVASVSVGDASAPPKMRRLGAVATVGILVWAGFCSLSVRASEEADQYIVDERDWYDKSVNHPHPVTLKDYQDGGRLDGASRFIEMVVRKHCPEAYGWEGRPCEPVVHVLPFGDNAASYRETYPLRASIVDRGFVMTTVQVSIGMISLLFGPQVYMVDIVGLSDPIASRLLLNERGRPGHERFLPMSWYVARFSEPTEGEDRAISAARRALECGKLAELQRAVEDELTVSRFLENMKSAYSLHQMKIDPDPESAERFFCAG